MTPQVFFESSLTQTDPMVLDAIKKMSIIDKMTKLSLLHQKTLFQRQF